MVEMLGTLAIIGVLSIGGIAGYSYGMDKYRANTVINDVMLRAVDVISKSNTGNITLSDWPTTTGANWTIGLEENTNGIQVSGVPQRVCQMIFDGLIHNASIKISGTQYDTPNNDVCADDNTMFFYVDEDMLNNNLSGGGNTTTITTPIVPEESEVIAVQCEWTEWIICQKNRAANWSPIFVLDYFARFNLFSNKFSSASKSLG